MTKQEVMLATHAARCSMYPETVDGQIQLNELDYDYKLLSAGSGEERVLVWNSCISRLCTSGLVEVCLSYSLCWGWVGSLRMELAFMWTLWL